MKAYENASNYIQKSHVGYKELLVKLAQINVKEGKYSKAGEFYEELATEAMSSQNSTLASFVAPGHILDSFLCRLAEDEVAASKLLDRFKSDCPSLANSKQGKFGLAIMESIESQDEEKFSEALHSFDSPSDLTQNRISILLVIKKRVFSESNLE